MTHDLDNDWVADHPLPPLDIETDKNARGRVLVAGGAEFVPGALRLTGEAALRAGAGKLQLATVGSAAIALAVLVPEAAMIALPSDADGEIAPEAAEILEKRLERCDALVLGPGMSIGARTDQLVARLLRIPAERRTIILDAAALTSARELAPLIARHDGRVIMTPHHGEMAHLMGADVNAIGQDPGRWASLASERFHAVILLKSSTSFLAAPDGTLLAYRGGCPGLATGGSGDVLAGIIGGLAARGASPLLAAAWGCWLHGEAGRRLSQEVGPVGFLAREIPSNVPRILRECEQGGRTSHRDESGRLRAR